MAPVEDITHMSSEEELDVHAPLAASFDEEVALVVPERRRGRRGRKIVVVLGSTGIALLAIVGVRTMIGDKAKHDANVPAPALRELQYGGSGYGGGNGGPGFAGPAFANLANVDNDPNHIQCGWGVCTCEWATGGATGLCSQVDNPRTHCWSCCCQHLFPAEYQHAIAAQYNPMLRWRDGYYGNDQYVVTWNDDWDCPRGSYCPRDPHSHHWESPGDHDHDGQEFSAGEAVQVEDRDTENLWRRATIIERTHGGHYKVIYKETGKTEIVDSDRIALAEWRGGSSGSSVWSNVLGILLWVCLIAACVGAIGWWLNRERRRKAQLLIADRPVVIAEERPDRWCS